ncbi:MAG TPA: hypothetical protein VFZ77_16490, partial [Acidimicrobiales bacterium]
AVIRWSWALGRPIGAPRSFVEMLGRNQPGVAAMEAVLATFACLGAVLTAGLAMRWGRTFPSWLPRVGGRPVPMWLPLSLGTSAAVAIFPFGRTAWQDIIGVRPAGGLDELQLWGLDIDRPAFWGVGGLGWLFPLWAVSLAVALAGYHHGRRLAGLAEPGPRPPAPVDRRRPTWSAVAGVSAAAVATAVLPVHGVTDGWVVPYSPALPPPTGAHPVGVRDVHLVDAGRSDPLVSGSGHRELMVSVFYPAAPGLEGGGSLDDLALAPYVSEQVAMRWGRDVSSDLGVRRDAVNWQFRIHARDHAPPASGRHPVLVFTPPPHALRSSYTLMAEELASHGYVVVTVDHTGEAPVVEFPGRRIEEATAGAALGTAAHRARARDLVFVATHLDRLGDELRPALDATRVGAFGYLPLDCEELRDVSRTPTLGALAVLATSPRCEPRPTGSGRAVPELVLQPAAEPVVAPDAGGTTPRKWRAVVTLPDAPPDALSDALVYLPQVTRHLGTGPRPDPRPDVRTATAISAVARRYLVAFFDTHLRARDTGMLQPGDRCHGGVCASVRPGP